MDFKERRERRERSARRGFEEQEDYEYGMSDHFADGCLQISQMAKRKFRYGVFIVWVLAIIFLR